jgi:GlpG protein
MRLIGSLSSESEARIFSDYLYASGINNKIEVARNGADQTEVWNIWVYSEDQLDAAKSLLDGYRNSPDAPHIREAAAVARQKREQEQQELKAYQKRVFTKRQIFPKYERMGVLTGTLIGISVAVAIFSQLGKDVTFIRYLLISEYFNRALIEVRNGQVWRLVTPIFIHFGFLHILFNMLWLRDLGSMIEQRQNARTLATLVVVIAAVSNVGQFLMSGPLFGGMSGVVYGLLGYTWIRGKYDPSSGLFVHPQTVTLMIIWFFVCLIGLVGHVANTAHGVGFAVGITWGFISAKIVT